MIDWSRIKILRDEIGADDIDEVVEIFLEEVEETIADLPNASSSEDFERGYHALKGSALNLGFSAFSALCQQGETAAAAGQTDVVSIAQLDECYTASKASFLEGYSSLAKAG
ncbi:Hpt domain-containing protein [Algirhabdus cladophorae]|uniref:Hpt domain-containing protein n=1 Tax=Algirhabdus cladophorae TaxID=3377108 RepID=UPI003B84A561